MLKRIVSLRAIVLAGVVTLALAALVMPLGASGSVSLTAMGVPYTQDFNTLASTGTSSAVPPGWALLESGTNANATYTAGTGSSNAGETYSFGTAGSSDRAFGTLRSGSLVPAIGASFTNDTGQTLTTLAIAYTGEQWRLGTAARVDRLDFQYSTNAADLGTASGTWVDVNELDFSTLDTVAPVGAKDGNSAAERQVVSYTITGLSIPPGGAFWIRWVDFDASGADDGLAIDDFSLTPSATAGPAGVGAATPASVVAGSSTLLTVAVTAGNPPSPVTGVTANLTAIGGPASQSFFDDGTNGDVTAGDRIYSFQATVSAASTLGSKTLPAVVTDLSGRTGAASVALTVQEAPPPFVPIHDIQGPGTVSPYAGQRVLTQGIVTAVRFNNGFFLQTPDAQADVDPNTSEGIFVFTSSAPPAAAAVGNIVTVIGTVQEFVPSADPSSPPQTEIAGSPNVTLDSTGNPLPAAVTLTSTDTDPLGSIEQLERFEGMRVHVPSLTVIAPTEGTVTEASATSASTGVYYAVISGVARPFREPGVEVPNPLPAGAPPTVTRFDANPERLRVDSNGQVPLSATQTTEVMAGAVVSDVTGVLDYGARVYTILPDPASQGVVSGLHGAIPVAAPLPHQLTIATANLERFFDTTNDPSVSDVALTTTAFSNRLRKVSLEVRDVMQSPDIIGVEEVENLTTLEAIAAQVNADAVAAGHPDPQYQAFLFEGNDVGGIDDGFLVKASRVSTLDVEQFGKDTTYVNPADSVSAILNDRPPTLLRARVDTAVDGPFDVTVIVNHLRSLSGVEDPVDGPRVRAKRLAQAEFLARFIQDRQQADPGERIVSVGDYNAFQFSDGLVDVIGTIKGASAPPDQVTLASGDLVDPDLTDLVDLAPAGERYSFLFDGNAQELDHLLVTANVLPLVEGIQWGRTNADFPESFRNDPNRPERLSDHDPVVAYVRLPAKTTLSVNASPNPANFNQAVALTAAVTTADVAVTEGHVTFSDGVSFTESVPVAFGQAVLVKAAADLGLGSHRVTAVYGDALGFGSSSGSVDVVVEDHEAPALGSLTDIVVEANGPSGSVVTFNPTAMDDTDGTVGVVCTPPSGTTFALGDTGVGCSTSDSHGNTATGSFTVTVRDSIPPTLTLPGAISVPAAFPGGAVVTFAVSASDSVDISDPVVCLPASGSIFVMGMTTVRCTATDAHHNVGAGTFTVAVRNNAPVAAPDRASTLEGEAVTIPVLANDSDLDGGTLRVSAVTMPGHGTASPGGGGVTYTPSADFAGTDTFAYTVVDDQGGAATATVTVTVSRVGRFVVFSTDLTRLDEAVVVHSGDVGANRPRRRDEGRDTDRDAEDRDHNAATVTIGERSVMRQEGSRVVGDIVRLDNGSTVWDVVENALVNRHGRIRGSVTSPMAVPFMALPVFPAIAPGSQKVTIAAGATRTLGPGAYGAVHVRSRATLFLTGGLYQVQSLELDERATVIVRGATELRVSANVDAGGHVRFVVDPAVAGLNASTVVVYVGGADDARGAGTGLDDRAAAVVRFGEDSVVQANVFAPEGTVRLDRGTRATGAFFGDHVIIGDRVELTRESGFR